jgi:hypothetical protein
MAKDQGWHGDSTGHAKAAKGMKAKDSSGSSAKGQGWHGDSTGHAKAAKGKSKDETSIKDKLFGSD